MTAQNSSPLVSIIIPVFNGAKFMRQAIDSALAQTYDNIEVIVVNDGSTDDTDKIAKSYKDKIRYYKKANGGVSTALNLGIKKMRGEYFSWLSHDDMYKPEKIAHEIEFLKKNKLLDKKVIPFSDYALITSRGRKIASAIINHELVVKKPEYAFLRGLINGNTLLIPKQAFDEYGDFDTDLKCTQDYEKWFELSKTYRFIHIPQELVMSRYHAGQTTNTSPMVKIEGDKLWLRMIKSVSPDRRKEMNGSDYAFFYYLIQYLKNTPYDGALKYCEQEMHKLTRIIVKDEQYMFYDRPLFSENKMIRFVQIVQREGIINTWKRIINKVRKGVYK